MKFLVLVSALIASSAWANETIVCQNGNTSSLIIETNDSNTTRHGSLQHLYSTASIACQSNDVNFGDIHCVGILDHSNPTDIVKVVIGKNRKAKITGKFADERGNFKVQTISLSCEF